MRICWSLGISSIWDWWHSDAVSLLTVGLFLAHMTHAIINSNSAGWSSFIPTDEDLLVTGNIVHMGSMTQWCSQSPHCWFVPSLRPWEVYDHYDGCSEEMPNMLLWPWYFGIKKFIFQLLKKYENFFAMNLDMFPKLWAYSRNIFFVPMYISCK